MQHAAAARDRTCSPRSHGLRVRFLRGILARSPSCACNRFVTEPDAVRLLSASEGCLSPCFRSKNFGAGEGIRTLDPNLGKGVIVAFNECVPVHENLAESTRARSSEARANVHWSKLECTDDDRRRGTELQPRGNRMSNRRLVAPGLSPVLNPSTLCPTSDNEGPSS
ncbi:MAG: hypothetical protein K0R61_2718 [Microvirga sp.]|nr:hypothetical protein [Microvirga sp.]